MAETQTSESLIGTSIGSYRIVERIGVGGMGVVYLAEHPELAKRAAIKVMLPALSQNPEATARFQAEARAAAQLRHPAFVAVFDFGQLPNGSAFIAMDLLEGRSLRTLGRDQERLPLAAALKIGRQLASGMAVAHQAGIVHRDLKPDNIFLEVDPADGEQVLVKILDFGVAKLVQGTGAAPITQSGSMLGTPLYMSPEQCRGERDIDGRSDIYAWGCLLYAMLAGAPPFHGLDGYAGVIAAHLFRAPEPLRMRAPAAPAEVEALVMRCLAKKREQRPASMGEVVSELDRIAETLQLGSLTQGPHLDEVGLVRPSERPRATSASLSPPPDAPATRKLPEAPAVNQAGRSGGQSQTRLSGKKWLALGASAIALVGAALALRGTRWFDRSETATTRSIDSERAPGSAQESARLIQRAVDLRRAGKEDEALPLMQRAYAASPNARAAVQLGLVEYALKRWTDADLHLSQGLQSKDDPWIKRYLKTIEDSLTYVRSHTGLIDLVGDPPGAEVIINSRTVGKVPLPGPVRVNAGAAIIELRAPGFTPVLQVHSIEGGESESVTLRLRPADAPSPKTAGARPTRRSKH